MKCTWRLVLKIVGASLAFAGAVCLVVAYWDKLMAVGSAAKAAVTSRCGCKCSEFADYEDEIIA